jgi:hypothetical protein
MLNVKLLAAAIAVSIVTVPALAQEMRCGNLLISGDQIHPLLKEQVLKECGEPTSKDYNRWYYETQGKILVFNDNDELDHIEEASDPE